VIRAMLCAYPYGGVANFQLRMKKTAAWDVVDDRIVEAPRDKDHGPLIILGISSTCVLEFVGSYGKFS
jgi:hypothetical protein